MITDKELNIIRGKALVGAATEEEVMAVFDRLDAMADLMDGADQDDAFGTEGWRHALGIEY